MKTMGGRRVVECVESTRQPLRCSLPRRGPEGRHGRGDGELLDEYGPRISEAKASVEEAHGYPVDIADALERQDNTLRIDQEALPKVKDHQVNPITFFG